MKQKLTYEPIEINLIPLTSLDVISTSGGFDGEDDDLDW